LRREFAVLVTTYKTVPHSSEVEFVFLFCYWALQNKYFQNRAIGCNFHLPFEYFCCSYLDSMPKQSTRVGAMFMNNAAIIQNSKN